MQLHVAITKSSPKVAEGGAELATVTVKPPTCDPAPEQRLEVQRLVLLRLHGVVSGSHQNRAKPPAALSRRRGFCPAFSHRVHQSTGVGVRGTVLVHPNPPSIHQPLFILHKTDITARSLGEARIICNDSCLGIRNEKD